MDLILLHPKVVHLPIALAVLMPLLSLGLLVALWRDWLPRRAWLIAVAAQLVLVVSSFAAMQTGEADEEVVERVVAEQVIEEHEEAAELFSYATAALLLLFLPAAFIEKRSMRLAAAAAAFVGTLVVFALGYRVGDKGGELVYEHGAASAHSPASSPTPTSPPRVEDDDHH